jgi:hypothetical protein
MTTWDEWFAYLDSLVDTSTRGQLPDVCDFLKEAQRCRSEMGFTRNDPRVRILDELWNAALLLIYLDMLAAETHRLSAAWLYARWKESVSS